MRTFEAGDPIPKPLRRYSVEPKHLLVFPLLNPPPGDLRIPPGRPHLDHLWRIFCEKTVFKEVFEEWSNFNAFSTSIFERLGSVLEGQDGSQIHQKSIKIEFPRPSVSASFFISIFDRFLLSTSTPGSQKSVLFLRKNKVFSKNRLSKITSISASILVPTCLHVGLQNRRFSDFWRFQEAFKISSFFASIFYRFWVRLGLQHGAILGAKAAQNSKKWSHKT